MNVHAHDIDFPAIAAEVARKLLGDPNPALSSANELRFGSRGSLSVDPRNAVWHDHERGVGGGILDLIARETGCANGAAVAWLREHGLAPGREPDQAAQQKGVRRRIVASYAYTDEQGRLLFEVCRFQPKDFRQRRPDGRGDWTWKLGDVRRVLYRLPEIAAAPDGVLVLVVEGEKDADRLAQLGFIATTCSGGAGKWQAEYAKALNGHRVAILPDNDDAGRDHAKAVLRSLREAGVRAAVLALDGLSPKGDVSDWLDAGGDPHELERMAESAVGEAPAEASGRRSRFYSAAELNGRPVPPREWVVEDRVPLKQVTLFQGDGGTGKSQVGHQLCVSVAAGRPWLGMPVRAGRVIFLSCEDDDDELHRRTDNILRAHGLGYDDVAGLTLRSLAGEDALLAVEGQLALMRTALFDELEATAADAAPVLVMLDTLADVYPANENDRAKVRQFIGLLRGLAIRQRCAVMLLGHPSLTGLSTGSGTSGSTAWNNSVRSRLYLSRIKDAEYEPDADRRILTTMKANYAATGAEIAMRWLHGVFVADEPETSLERTSASMKAERVFLKLLDIFTEQGRHVSPSPSATFAPSVFAKHPEAEGCTRRALRTAMEVLLRSGQIVLSEHGRGASKRQHITRCAA